MLTKAAFIFIVKYYYNFNNNFSIWIKCKIQFCFCDIKVEFWIPDFWLIEYSKEQHLFVIKNVTM